MHRNGNVLCVSTISSPHTRQRGLPALNMPLEYSISPIIHSQDRMNTIVFYVLTIPPYSIDIARLYSYNKTTSSLCNQKKSILIPAVCIYIISHSAFMMRLKVADIRHTLVLADNICNTIFLLSILNHILFDYTMRVFGICWNKFNIYGIYTTTICLCSSCARRYCL